MDAVVATLVRSGILPRLPEAARAPQASRWYDAANTYGSAAPHRAVGMALDELTHAIAAVLLSESYGTGEYELYGAFTFDLATGEVLDDPAAAEPPSRY